MFYFHTSGASVPAEWTQEIEYQDAATEKKQLLVYVPTRKGEHRPAMANRDAGFRV